MARMLGYYTLPFCIGASCRRISYGPDCAAKCRGKRATKALERREWMREYEDDEFDFWQLRHDAGWFFCGPQSPFWKSYYSEAYNERYAEFGVTPSGWPVRRTP